MRSAVISILSFKVLVSCVFCLFSLDRKRFISFIDLLYESVLGVIAFAMAFPLSISLISTLIFSFYFLLFTSGLTWSPFLFFEGTISSSWSQLDLFFSTIGICAISFIFLWAILLLHQKMSISFLFLLISFQCLKVSLAPPAFIYVLITSVLLIFQHVDYPAVFLVLISSWIPRWNENVLCMALTPHICKGVFSVPTPGLSFASSPWAWDTMGCALLLGEVIYKIKVN